MIFAYIRPRNKFRKTLLGQRFGQANLGQGRRICSEHQFLSGAGGGRIDVHGGLKAGTACAIHPSDGQE